MGRKNIILICMGAIALLAYNVAVFGIGGFVNHGVAFWISYIFMLVACTAMAVSIILLEKSRIKMRDWLFKWPLIKHSAIYAVAELIVSTVFMLFDKKVGSGAAFVVQFVVLCIYLIFALSCFLAKEIITSVNEQVKDSMQYMKTLQIEIDSIVNEVSDPDVKSAFMKLADIVRYSDPESSEELKMIEEEISLGVQAAKSCIRNGESQQALALCNRINTYNNL